MGAPLCASESGKGAPTEARPYKLGTQAATLQTGIDIAECQADSVKFAARSGVRGATCVRWQTQQLANKRGQLMARRKEGLRDESIAREYLAPAAKAPEPSPADVRSNVQQHFTLMEQAHDRIRVQELAARLRDRPGS